MVCSRLRLIPRWHDSSEMFEKLHSWSNNWIGCQTYSSDDLPMMRVNMRNWKWEKPGKNNTCRATVPKWHFLEVTLILVLIHIPIFLLYFCPWHLEILHVDAPKVLSARLIFFPNLVFFHCEHVIFDETWVSKTSSHCQVRIGQRLFSLLACFDWLFPVIQCLIDSGHQSS